MTHSLLDGKHGPPHPSSLRKGADGRTAKPRTHLNCPYPGQGSWASRVATPSERVERLQKSTKGHPPP
jgi:hypothetical protein